jgi:tetratricopeptide (TPR) repeat protein
VAADPPKPSKDLAEARQAGLKLAHVVIEQLEAGDQDKFPGIQAWLKDLRKATKGISPEKPVAEWPAVEIDALMARNPNFWPAYFEIAPGDPGLMMLHAGLLLTAGEMTRASHILAVAVQRPGIPPDVRKALLGMLGQASAAGKASHTLIEDGVKLHDKGEYAAALRKYDEALGAWPQNGLAHYEIGYTIYTESLIAAGEKPPPPGTLIVNAKRSPPAKVLAAYAKARHHDPLLFNAYQGDDKAVVEGLQVLVKKGLPVWRKLSKEPETKADDKDLHDFAEACQEAGIHELGLAARQVLVARRGRYAPADHPYFTTSLQKLAPGEQTEALLKRLATGTLKVRQLIAPEKTRKDFALTQLRLYVPIPDLPKRVGEDIEPLANYVKAFDEPIQRWMEKEKPKANGLLIAVGIKSGKKSRMWCQAVEGDIPAAALQRLEQELGKVATIDLKKEPVAFGLEVVIGGRKVETFPEFPTEWIDAVKKAKIKVIVPPDELFKHIWPD